MLFWLAVEKLKKETDQAAVKELAQSIYRDYLSSESPKEVSKVLQKQKSETLNLYLSYLILGHCFKVLSKVSISVTTTPPTGPKPSKMHEAQASCWGKTQGHVQLCGIAFCFRNSYPSTAVICECNVPSIRN